VSTVYWLISFWSNSFSKSLKNDDRSFFSSGSIQFSGQRNTLRFASQTRYLRIHFHHRQALSPSSPSALTSTSGSSPMKHLCTNNWIEPEPWTIRLVSWQEHISTSSR